MTEFTNSDKISVLLKNVLEYNASIVTLGVSYMGAFTPDKRGQRNRERFVKDYKKATEGYIKLQNDILEDLAESITKEHV